MVSAREDKWKRNIRGGDIEPAGGYGRGDVWGGGYGGDIMVATVLVDRLELLQQTLAVGAAGSHYLVK